MPTEVLKRKSIDLIPDDQNDFPEDQKTVYPLKPLSGDKILDLKNLSEGNVKRFTPEDVSVSTKANFGEAQRITLTYGIDKEKDWKNVTDNGTEIKIPVTQGGLPDAAKIVELLPQSHITQIHQTVLEISGVKHSFL